jgi:hypothetical protein
MSDVRGGPGCPRCKCSSTRSIHRERWMRLIPGTSCFKCPDCHVRIVYFLWLFRVRRL